MEFLTNKIKEFLTNNPDQKDYLKEIITEISYEPDFLYMVLTMIRASKKLGTKIYGENERRIIKQLNNLK